MSEYNHRMDDLDKRCEDIDTLEPFFSTHMNAMTEEDLHSKVDIALELAARDSEIQTFKAENSALKADNETMRKALEHIASNWALSPRHTASDALQALAANSTDSQGEIYRNDQH